MLTGLTAYDTRLIRTIYVGGEDNAIADIDVKRANGGLTIEGKKQEEKKKDYFPHERRFGAVERYFQMPEGVDHEKIAASFEKGVLTGTLPKLAEARKAKKIPVKAA
ncbi:hypothetical protein LMG28688_02781 [Paraburkholderia caffeinitolerans]|uniref:SHSP domain-containing protein n=1 Tax=Paraburkholderia caffeinitolerans TaxID=1723730 RepID=A0A6J5G187_9BURK|nr:MULTISPECIES: Hsp20/alpha crystallin family protein [Paraburkholderia]CAB3788901.1 hypothetical protein LMG28688_02781 [Paraburkholderia caffeinitolerans]